MVRKPSTKKTTRRTSTTKKKAVSKTNAKQKKADKQPSAPDKLTKKQSNEENDGLTVLFKSQANKISPRAEGTISHELVKDEKGVLYLRLTDNSSSGNFCKSPVKLQSIIDVLNKQEPDKPFNSKVMSKVFEGKGSNNSNNTSFLMAALRSKKMGLTVADKETSLSSKLSPSFKSQSEQLLGMS